MGAPPLEKVNNCWVKFLACSDAFSTFVSFSTTLFSCVYSLASATLSTIAVKILLKSWAIPPARIPSDSSFWARNRSCSIFCLSVTSLNTRTTPIILLFLSRMGAPLSATTLSVLSFAMRSTSLSGSTRKPWSSTSATGFSQGIRVSSLTVLKISFRGLPAASS